MPDAPDRADRILATLRTGHRTAEHRPHDVGVYRALLTSAVLGALALGATADALRAQLRSRRDRESAPLRTSVDPAYVPTRGFDALWLSIDEAERRPGSLRSWVWLALDIEYVATCLTGVSCADLWAPVLSS